jgi:excisionase family DNA binding protein
MNSAIPKTPSSAIVPPLLTPQQVAEALACSRDLVLDIIHKRELPAVLISRSQRSRKPLYRVKPADLESFIQSRLMGPAYKRPPRRPPYERIV